MERHFEQQLDELKEQLLRMSGRAEAILRKSIAALEARDVPLATEVFADDKVIDQLEMDVEERCVGLLALQQPLARDLRFITSALKLSNDLERIGDHGVNIAGCVLDLVRHPAARPVEDLPRLAESAIGMLRDALDAFVRRDADAARKLVLRDDEVDQMHRAVFGELIRRMIEDPTQIERCMTLVLVSRNLERVGDLATNIAEEVVFIAEARVIKHHAEDRGEEKDEFSRS